jgi:hypothetical protein
VTKTAGWIPVTYLVAVTPPFEHQPHQLLISQLNFSNKNATSKGSQITM